MRETLNPARWQAALEDGLSRGLPGFLPTQRWFGAKARRIESARAEDIAWLPGSAEACALVVAQVEYTSGPPERYALLVSLCAEAPPEPAIGDATVDGRTLHLVEASSSPHVATALLRRFDCAQDIAGSHGGRLRVGDLPADGEAVPGLAGLDETQVRSLGAEQSNTTLRVGPGRMFKLLRRLEPGENPELEIGRFLVERTRFRAAPELRGSLTWFPADGEPCTLGVLQDHVANLGDGWQWALTGLEQHFSAAAAPEPMVNAVLSLGVVTAEFHAAISSCADAVGFAPVSVTPEHAAAWQREFRTRVDHAGRMIEETHERLEPTTHALCESLLQRRAQLLAVADFDPADAAGTFELIRLHGDYHLGQTLKIQDGFVLIDFEGEPARPLPERRELGCALRDVAGMLRSFDYAIETARRRAPAAEVWTGPAPPLRESFLEAYVQHALDLGSRFLPVDPGVRARWIRFFEIGKALYELEYEIQNRPAWLPIPARGLLHLLDGVAL
ncbi:MAG: hypothetical protein ABI960_01230 [Candidatus Eisenbacteria bacterium]